MIFKVAELISRPALIQAQPTDMGIRVIRSLARVYGKQVHPTQGYDRTVPCINRITDPGRPYICACFLNTSKAPGPLRTT